MNDTPEEKVAAYYAIKPTQYKMLKSLTISQSLGVNGYMEQRLSLVLEYEQKDHPECLYMDFWGVTGLQIEQPATSHIVLPLVEIVLGKNLPDFEGTYLVRDPEQTRFLWFVCRDFCAVVG